MEERKQDRPTLFSFVEEMSSGFQAVLRKMSFRRWIGIAQIWGSLNTQPGLKVLLRVWGDGEQDVNKCNETLVLQPTMAIIFFELWSSVQWRILLVPRQLWAQTYDNWAILWGNMRHQDWLCRLPWWLSGEESAYQCRRWGFDLGRCHMLWIN